MRAVHAAKNQTLEIYKFHIADRSLRVTNANKQTAAQPLNRAATLLQSHSLSPAAGGGCRAQLPTAPATRDSRSAY